MSTSRHILVEMLKDKDKEKIFKAAREKWITYRNSPVRLTADLSAETMDTRRHLDDIFQVFKEKNLSTRNPLDNKSFKNEGIIKTFPDKQNLKEFVVRKFTLQKYCGISSDWKQVITDNNSIPHEKTKNTNKGNYKRQYKYLFIFLSATNRFKNNYIKQYVYNYLLIF